MKLILLLLGLLSSLAVLSQTSLITTTEIPTDKCTHVHSASSIPQPNVSSVLVGRFAPRLSGSPYTTYRTLVEFPIGLPSNAVITSAKLKMYISSTSGTPTIYAARLSAPWSENDVVWGTQPAYETSDIITTSSIVSNWLTFDVTSHVQKMNANVYDNNGWLLYLSNETQSLAVNRYFASDDAINTSQIPKLEVTYYIPMSITNATIVHANTSSPTETTGSISPVLTNGPGGAYSYQWYNASGAMSGKTSLNLSGVPYGWYGLKVTSSLAGTAPFFYSFLVGVNCEEVTIPFNPGPDYIDDAMIRNRIDYTTINYGTSYQLIDAYEGQGYWEDYDARMNLLRFRLWIDGEITIEEGDLLLRSQTNLSPSGYNNAAQFHYVTSDWSEGIVTYSSIPSYTNSPTAFPMPATSASNTDHVIDILAALENLQANNAENYGWLFRLNNYDNIATKYQRYYSSEHATVNYRPRINFSISVSNPTAPNYCNQVFAKMDRTLRGVLYKPYLTHLYFYYDEEYATSDAGLNYRVYKADAPLISVLNHTIQPLTEIEYGDNRYTLDVGDLQGGVYVLEITNNKSEKFYLRFKVED